MITKESKLNVFRLTVLDEKNKKRRWNIINKKNNSRIDELVFIEIKKIAILLEILRTTWRRWCVPNYMRSL